MENNLQWVVDPSNLPATPEVAAMYKQVTGMIATYYYELAAKGLPEALVSNLVLDYAHIIFVAAAAQTPYPKEDK